MGVGLGGGGRGGEGGERGGLDVGERGGGGKTNSPGEG